MIEQALKDAGYKNKKRKTKNNDNHKTTKNPNNVRDKNKHLRMIELAGKIIMIDTQTAERENNKAGK